MELVRSSPAGDLERNLKSLMTQTFARMDLVTREEFEIQAELLRSLRQRVDALERCAASTASTSPTGSGSSAGQTDVPRG